MDKESIVYDSKRAGEGRGMVLVLACVLLTLSITFVVVVIGASVYISNDDPTVACDERQLLQDITINMPETAQSSRPRTPPKEFYMGMPTLHLEETEYYHHYIHVDEARGTEYIEHKDRLFHIQTILYIDHKEGLQVLYPSEHAHCIFVRSRVHSLADNLKYLWSHDGANITLQSLDNIYRPGKSLTYEDDIPADVAGFCSLSNSYWLEEANDHEWSADEKYEACICSYFHCWCTYCTEPDCWGNCHRTQLQLPV